MLLQPTNKIITNTITSINNITDTITITFTDKIATTITSKSIETITKTYFPENDCSQNCYVYTFKNGCYFIDSSREYPYTYDDCINEMKGEEGYIYLNYEYINYNNIANRYHCILTSSDCVNTQNSDNCIKKDNVCYGNGTVDENTIYAYRIK